MNPWALKNFSKSTFSQSSLSPFKTDYSYNVTAGLIWIHNLKMYSQLFYALTNPLPPSQDELQGDLLNQSDLSISGKDFSFVFQISVKFALTFVSGLMQIKNRKEYISKNLITKLEKVNYDEETKIASLSPDLRFSLTLFYFLLFVFYFIGVCYLFIKPSLMACWRECWTGSQETTALPWLPGLRQIT